MILNEKGTGYTSKINTTLAFQTIYAVILIVLIFYYFGNLIRMKNLFPENNV